MRMFSIADVAAVVRGRRIDLGLSQGELAKRAGVSRKWVNEFEVAGKASAELGHVLRVFDTLGLAIQAEPADATRIDNGIDLDAILDDLRRG